MPFCSLYWVAVGQVCISTVGHYSPEIWIFKASLNFYYSQSGSWFSRVENCPFVSQVVSLCLVAASFTLHWVHGISDLRLHQGFENYSVLTKTTCSLFLYGLPAENSFYSFRELEKKML